MPPAVQIEHISKQYRIGAAQQAGYRTLRESLMHAATGPWRRFRELSHHRRAVVEHAPSAVSNGHVENGAPPNGHTSASGLATPHGPQNGSSADAAVAKGAASAKSAGPHQPMKVGRSSSETFWALNDVSFNVEHGEVVGIIGRNGAGKSTLLKILSRITEPTKGRVVINGRVASLLEVGTGFHPELTGRENIYLNGAILGMHQHEIKRKFDEIVEFSGIEQFLETPVKRYSSGMYVRLAFAVAAHLDPEILIVDEVLAVGDAEFQKKCLGKMQDVAASGRTVLFVSHNMPAIRSLTQRAVYLKAGKLLSIGPTSNVIDTYLDDCISMLSTDVSLDYFRRNRQPGSLVQFQSIWLDNKLSVDETLPVIHSGEQIAICFELEALEDISEACISIILTKDHEHRVATFFSMDNQFEIQLNEGRNRIRCHINDLPLSPGRYSISVGVNRNANSIAFDVLQDVPSFDVKLNEVESGEIDWPGRPWGGLHWNNVAWLKDK